MTGNLKQVLIVAVVACFSVFGVWWATGMEKIYENFDGPYYLAVAKSWYKQDVLRTNFSFPTPLEYYPAHFPGYPLLINLAALTGINRPQAMLAVNLAAGVTGAIFMFAAAQQAGMSKPWVAALVWLFFWPRMWAVRSVGSPETLFIAGIISSVYFFNRKMYWWSALGAIVAVVTKSPGILLILAYGLWATEDYLKNKRWEKRMYPVFLAGLALAGVFCFYKLQTGDFWAYFHSGDNIHLQILPFKVFDSNQPWVGNFWLEDVLWIYLAGAWGVLAVFRYNRVWGWWGLVFYISLLFVSHRDISRYSLPLIPVVLIGVHKWLEKKETVYILAGLLLPAFLYTLNFVNHNFLPIANWAPFL